MGDASGTIILTARNRQAETCKPGCTITVRNGKIDMFKGTMRLAVDRWGSIKSANDADFAVKTDYDLSAVQYEARPRQHGRLIRSSTASRSSSSQTQQ